MSKKHNINMTHSTLNKKPLLYFSPIPKLLELTNRKNDNKKTLTANPLIFLLYFKKMFVICTTSITNSRLDSNVFPNAYALTRMLASTKITNHFDNSLRSEPRSREY